MFLHLAPVALGGRLAISSRPPIPDPGLLLGGLATAVVPQVGLADRPGGGAVGHVLVPVVRPGESVHVDHHGPVDLERPNGPALVTDG